MLKIVVGNSEKNKKLLRKCYRFRHKIFVDERRWESLRKKDGLETDLFDTDDAIHIAYLDSDDVVAYSRLLPTSKPHLLSDVYPHLVNGKINYRKNDIYEWTRCCVERRYREYKKRTSTPYHYIICTIIKICLEKGIASLVVEFHPAHISSLIETGWHVEPLTLPTTIDDEAVVAVKASPTEHTYETTMKVFGMEKVDFERQFESRNIGDLARIEIAA